MKIFYESFNAVKYGKEIRHGEIPINNIYRDSREKLGNNYELVIRFETDPISNPFLIKPNYSSEVTNSFYRLVPRFNLLVPTLEKFLDDEFIHLDSFNPIDGYTLKKDLLSRIDNLKKNGTFLNDYKFSIDFRKENIGKTIRRGKVLQFSNIAMNRDVTILNRYYIDNKVERMPIEKSLGEQISLIISLGERNNNNLFFYDSSTESFVQHLFKVFKLDTNITIKNLRSQIAHCLREVKQLAIIPRYRMFVTEKYLPFLNNDYGATIHHFATAIRRDRPHECQILREGCLDYFLVRNSATKNFIDFTETEIDLSPIDYSLLKLR